MNSTIIERIESHLAMTKIPPTFLPVSEEILGRAESALGFKIPPLLRKIYANIANGGFGPGYGIIGVEGGRASNLGTLAKTYAEIKKGAEYLGLEWKPGVLAFCEWGCNIFSCVDCSDVRCPIIQSEECKTYVQRYTLEDFFCMWLDDSDILGSGSSSRNTAKIINPFTGKKMSVIGRGDFKKRDGGPSGER